MTNGIYDRYNTHYNRDLKKKPLTQAEKDWLAQEAEGYADRMLKGAQPNLIPFIMQAVAKRVVNYKDPNKPMRQEEQDHLGNDDQSDNIFGDNE